MVAETHKRRDPRTCGRFRDETGKRYGMLTVLKYLPAESGRGSKWLCECDCGNITVANGSDLRRMYKRSCGCLKEMDMEEREERGLYVVQGKRAVNG